MESISEAKVKSNELRATVQNSYYGKAKEIEYENWYFLKSYQEIVCAITPIGNFIRFWDGYSVTTLNHVNDFRENHGMEKLNKKDWKSIEVNKSMVIPSEIKNVEMKYKVTYC